MDNGRHDAITARISEIEAAMGTFGFFSSERKALEEEKSRLIRERHNIHSVAGTQSAPSPVVSGRFDPENAVTANTWRKMHG